MIIVEGLEVSYGRFKEPVLKNVNAVFDDKSLILGPNGSGKTTLFRALCGLTNIRKGRILVDGVNMEEIYAKTGVIMANFPEILSLLSIRVSDIIRLYADLTGGDQGLAHKILADLGISEDFLKSKKLHELSAGQTKAVCTAIALSTRAKHILLDEPFEQLDPARKNKLIRYLTEYDGIIILNTHETWLIKNLIHWKTFFMFEGSLYGPILVEELLNAKFSFQEEAKALMKLVISGKTISLISEGHGKPILSLESLDKIYELALEAEKS